MMYYFCYSTSQSQSRIRRRTTRRQYDFFRPVTGRIVFQSIYFCSHGYAFTCYDFQLKGFLRQIQICSPRFFPKYVVLIPFQITEHTAIFHILSIYDYTLICKICTIPVIQKDTSCLIYFFSERMMQIILVIFSLYHWKIQTNPRNLYPGNNILIDFTKLYKINRLLFCFTFCRIILLPVCFFFCVFFEFLILFLSVIIFVSDE